MPDISGLVTTTLLNTKIGEVENKIPDTNGLVTTIVLNTKIGEVENKIRNVNDLFNKTVYNAKISDSEKKYFITSDFNKFTGVKFDAKIKKIYYSINLTFSISQKILI